MDPATLAVTAVSLVTGYLSRHRNELVDRAGDAVVDRLAACTSGSVSGCATSPRPRRPLRHWRRHQPTRAGRARSS